MANEASQVEYVCARVYLISCVRIEGAIFGLKTKFLNCYVRLPPNMCAENLHGHTNACMTTCTNTRIAMHIAHAITGVVFAVCAHTNRHTRT